MGDHPSLRPTRGVPRRADGPSTSSARPCSGWGLPSAGVAPGDGALLPHRFTLACADPGGRPSAVCSLLPDPSDRSDLALASTLPCGVPTFLDGTDPEVCAAAATRTTHQRSQCASTRPPRRTCSGHAVRRPVGYKFGGVRRSCSWWVVGRPVGYKFGGGGAGQSPKSRPATGGRAPPVADRIGGARSPPDVFSGMGPGGRVPRGAGQRRARLYSPLRRSKPICSRGSETTAAFRARRRARLAGAAIAVPVRMSSLRFMWMSTAGPGGS